MLKLISTQEAAQQLGVHQKTVSRLMRQGALNAAKVANRWVIDASSLSAFQRSYSGKKGRPVKTKRRRRTT